MDAARLVPNEKRCNCFEVFWPGGHVLGRLWFGLGGGPGWWGGEGVVL